jgi:hypothetical protein
LWGSQLRIFLAPDQVVAVQVARGWSNRVEKKAVWTCKSQPSDQHAWEGAVRTLSAGLATFNASGAHTSVLLSNYFARYVLVPWSDHVTGAQERQVMARIHFEKHFGGVASHWDIRLNAGTYGQATLASAIDATLSATLQHACSDARLNMVSLQPYWMTVINRYGTRLKSGNWCVAVVEPGRVGLLMAQGGQWHAVRSLPIHGNLAQQLQPLIRREMLLSGLPMPARIYLHAPTEPGLTLSSASDVQTEVLDVPKQAGFSPRADAVYGMAMGAVR